MDAALDAYLAWLTSNGVQFEVSAGLARHADHDGQLVPDPAPVRDVQVDGLPPVHESRDVGAGLAADHATAMVGRCLQHPDVRTEGARMVDVGCGTGVLLVLASRLGATTVAGTDVDPRAIELARQTVADAGVDAALHEGPLLETLPPDDAVDLLVANLPHKPCPEGFDLPTSQRGGPDGAMPHVAFAAQASDRLLSGGRVLFFLHSLPHPRLLANYGERFDLRMLAWKRRFLVPGEYGPLEDVFLERAAHGESFIGEDDGRRFLVAAAWLASKR